MREYQSHKKVKAAQIKSVGLPDVNKGTAVILDDGTEVSLPQDMTLRHFPLVGDYLVEYEDGYKSISPQKAFEDGYTPIYAEDIRSPDNAVEEEGSDT